MTVALENREDYSCFFDSASISDFGKKIQEKFTALVAAFRLQIEVRNFLFMFDPAQLPYPATCRHSSRIIVSLARTGAGSNHTPLGKPSEADHHGDGFDQVHEGGDQGHV